MTEIRADAALVACCGLYCGACGAFLKGRCQGCRENARAGWCKVRACCLERGYASCADCADHADPATCGKFDNFVARAIGLVLRSDRRACVLKARELGSDGYAAFMAGQRAQTFDRKGRPRTMGPRR